MMPATTGTAMAGAATTASQAMAATAALTAAGMAECLPRNLTTVSDDALVG